MLHDRSPLDRRAVLVIEDSDDDFDTVVEAATQAQVSDRLIRVADAEAARSLLAQATAGSFVFILLDYKLPGMDGLAFLENVRRDPVLSKLPAVVFTSSANPCDRDAFYRAGADGFHVKSVQHTDSLQTLATIFEHWLRRAPPRHPVLPP